MSTIITVDGLENRCWEVANVERLFTLLSRSIKIRQLPKAHDLSEWPRHHIWFKTEPMREILPTKVVIFILRSGMQERSGVSAGIRLRFFEADAVHVSGYVEYRVRRRAGAVSPNLDGVPPP
jgi:hypothetical protein